MDRELIALLANSRGWGGRPIGAGDIRLATNRITIELGGTDRSRGALLVKFEERGGLLVAGIEDRDWLAALEPSAIDAFEEALAGFYKIAGVVVAREQLNSHLPEGTAGCEFLEEGVLVQMEADFGPARFYPLKPASDAGSRVAHGAAKIMGADACRELLFAWNPITWQHWVTVWQGDMAGVPVPSAQGGPLRLLPEGDVRAACNS